MMIREKVYKVRLLKSELESIKSLNISTVAKFLRESALHVVNKTEPKTMYSKLDHDFVLELSRIGNNINQIATAVNTHIAKDEPFSALKLLHLLIAIDQRLEELRAEQR